MPVGVARIRLPQTTPASFRIQTIDATAALDTPDIIRTGGNTGISSIDPLRSALVMQRNRMDGTLYGVKPINAIS